jgi:hypothetical protein
MCRNPSLETFLEFGVALAETEKLLLSCGGSGFVLLDACL